MCLSYIIYIRSCLLQKSTSILTRTFLFPSPCAPIIISSPTTLVEVSHYHHIYFASFFLIQNVFYFVVDLFDYTFFVVRSWYL
uniref:Putative product n=1 Tax=Xenopsylla cheopis TaxID=163159 RepID=A0A6M2DM17_XENCH